MPALELRRREGDVDRLGLGQRVDPAALQGAGALRDRGGDRLLRGVAGLAQRRPLLGGNGAQVGEDLGELSLATQVAHPDLLQLGLGASPGHGFECASPELLDAVGHQSRLRRTS